MNNMVSIEKITDMGLLTELVYLRLESEEYNLIDSNKTYSLENISNFIYSEKIRGQVMNFHF